MGSRREEYAEYMQSDTWKTIRAQRLALDNGECVLCGESAEHVHHRRYPEAFGNETIKDLVCLCGACHKLHHGTIQTTERRLSDIDSRLEEIFLILQWIRDGIAEKGAEVSV
jgi:5-methylcytosine-specific restriction endonuclease McrA